MTILNIVVLLAAVLIYKHTMHCVCGGQPPIIHCVFYIKFGVRLHIATMIILLCHDEV